MKLQQLHKSSHFSQNPSHSQKNWEMVHHWMLLNDLTHLLSDDSWWKCILGFITTAYCTTQNGWVLLLVWARLWLHDYWIILHYLQCKVPLIAQQTLAMQSLRIKMGQCTNAFLIKPLQHLHTLQQFPTTTQVDFANKFLTLLRMVCLMSVIA